jgi:membrane protein DedA with SNARE-associated domain
MDQLLSLPFGIAWAVLFVVVLVRTNATYWLGRGIAAGATRSRRLAARLARPGPARRIARGQRLLDRWGPFAIVLTFLTVGLQTAVNLAAGLGRMHLRYYLPATVVGSVVWSFVYATVGLAAFDLWFDHVAGTPWIWLAVAAAATAVVVRALVVRRARARPAGGAGGSAAIADDTLDQAAQRGADPERSET